MLIFDLWGISFHAMVVFGLGKNLLFYSVLGRFVCIVQIKDLTGIEFVDYFDERPKLKIPTAI